MLACQFSIPFPTRPYPLFKRAALASVSMPGSVKRRLQFLYVRVPKFRFIRSGSKHGTDKVAPATGKDVNLHCPLAG